MARRRSEPLNTSPAAELEARGSASHLQPDPAGWRNRKGKSFYVNRNNRSRRRHFRTNTHPVLSPTVATRTRAQTKQKLEQNSAGRVTRQQRHLEQLKTACSSSSSPTNPSPSPANPSPRGSTVAATTSRATPASGQGPATRSRSDRLRERVKVDTPDTSNNGVDVDRHLEDVNGNASPQDGIHSDRQDGVAGSGDEGEESDREEEQEDEDGSVAEADSDGDVNLGDIMVDVEDVGEEVVVGALQARSSSGEDDEDDDDEEDTNGDDEDDSEDGDGESCHCTSNWSCGGHAGQARHGPNSSASRFQGKRHLDDDGDENGDVSPSKKGCRLVSRTRANLRSLTSLGLGGASCSKPARQRIPSREHPPPKLQQWLDTFKAWSNAERMMALDDLIALCDPSQVRHMMHVIEPQFQRDFISLLPKELALYVLSFLEPRDLLRAAQTCRYWHILCEDNLLWREKCREEGIDETLVYGSRPRRRPGPRSPCKALFMRQSQIEHNWRTGTSRSPKILKGHDDHVITCLEFCGHRIVSGSDDNTLKVWSVLSGKCLRTLVGHTGGVWSSQMSGNIIISGSTDRTLKVWNADSGACKHTLYGHTSTVRCMSLCGNKVVSGSRDATLRVWDIETGQCLHVLMGHVAAVRCVQYDGRRVVSGAYDYTVRVWDPETETCLHTLQGHSNRVYSLQFDGIHVVSGSLDTSIRVWDVETGACLHTLIGHQSLTSGLELKDNILVSGNADSTVKVWDITTGQCLQTLQGPNKHQSAVTCLQFSKKFVITSSDDGTVKIWDLKTGEFLRNLVSLESGGSGGVVWRLRCSNTKLVCAVGSRNGTEETKLMVLDFDVEDKKLT